MTKDELYALALTMPVDTLYPRTAAARFLIGVSDVEAATAYCCRMGWWDQRNQWGVRELWRDGTPHMKATYKPTSHV